MLLYNLYYVIPTVTLLKYNILYAILPPLLCYFNCIIVKITSCLKLLCYFNCIIISCILYANIKNVARSLNHTAYCIYNNTLYIFNPWPKHENTELNHTQTLLY